MMAGRNLCKKHQLLGRGFRKERRLHTAWDPGVWIAWEIGAQAAWRKRSLAQMTAEACGACAVWMRHGQFLFAFFKLLWEKGVQHLTKSVLSGSRLAFPQNFPRQQLGCLKRILSIQNNNEWDDACHAMSFRIQMSKLCLKKLQLLFCAFSFYLHFLFRHRCIYDVYMYI